VPFKGPGHLSRLGVRPFGGAGELRDPPHMARSQGLRAMLGGLGAQPPVSGRGVGLGERKLTPTRRQGEALTPAKAAPP
jgi:hypothetical protein